MSRPSPRTRPTRAAKADDLTDVARHLWVAVAILTDSGDTHAHELAADLKPHLNELERLAGLDTPGTTETAAAVQP